MHWSLRRRDARAGNDQPFLISGGVEWKRRIYVPAAVGIKSFAFFGELICSTSQKTTNDVGGAPLRESWGNPCPGHLFHSSTEGTMATRAEKVRRRQRRKEKKSK